MNIKLNGEKLETNSNNISDFLIEHSINTKGIAVAINNCVVNRELWEQTQLKDNDEVVIISAAYGG